MNGLSDTVSKSEQRFVWLAHRYVSNASQTEKDLPNGCSLVAGDWAGVAPAVRHTRYDHNINTIISRQEIAVAFGSPLIQLCNVLILEHIVLIRLLNIRANRGLSRVHRTLNELTNTPIKERKVEFKFSTESRMPLKRRTTSWRSNQLNHCPIALNTVMFCDSKLFLAIKLLN